MKKKAIMAAPTYIWFCRIQAVNESVNETVACGDAVGLAVGTNVGSRVGDIVGLRVMITIRSPNNDLISGWGRLTG